MIIEFTGKDLRAMSKKDIDKKLKDGFKKAIKQSKKDQKERLKKYRLNYQETSMFNEEYRSNGTFSSLPLLWQQITFKTQKGLDIWRDTHKHKYQIEEVFINNGYCLDYRPLKKG